MKLWARKTVEADFTVEELKVLIASSLYGEQYEQSMKILERKFGGEGYISGYEVEEQAYKLDKEKYGCGGFEDIEW